MSSPFDIRPAQNHDFSPRKDTMNVREQFLVYLHQHGWTLDTTVTKQVRRYGGERVQDPNAFVRHSPNGVWHLWLDYTISGDSWRYRTGNTLRGLTMWLELPGEDGKRPKGRRRFELRGLPSERRYSYDELWEVTGRDIGNDHGKATRMRAERVGADPDVCAWLAQEAEWQEDQAELERRAERNAAYERSQGPVPGTTVSGEQWRDLARPIRRIASDLAMADGNSTNALDLLAQLKKATAALEAVVSKEGNHE